MECPAFCLVVSSGLAVKFLGLFERVTFSCNDVKMIENGKNSHL